MEKMEDGRRKMENEHEDEDDGGGDGDDAQSATPDEVGNIGGTEASAAGCYRAAEKSSPPKIMENLEKLKKQGEMRQKATKKENNYNN